MDPVSQVIIVIGLLILLGAAGEAIFSRTGIPDVIWLVGAGILAGPVMELVKPELVSPVLPFFGGVALVIILVEGGTKTQLTDLLSVAPRAAMLAISGFVFSVILTCIFFYCMIHLGVFRPAPLSLMILIGCIVGGTSSVIIIPTMASRLVDRRVAKLLEAESCFTDALCVVMGMLMIDLMLSGEINLINPFLGIGRTVGLGLGLGAVGGLALLPAMRYLYGKPHAYAVMLAALLVFYGLIQWAGGNGALGVLLSSVILGSAPALLRKFRGLSIKKSRTYMVTEDVLQIHGHIVFFTKAFFFFLIGLHFPTNPILILAGAILAVVLLIARIPAVYLSFAGAGIEQRQKNFAFIAVPRGLAAGVLATMPFQEGIPGSQQLAPGVFSMIISSILLFTVGFAIASMFVPKAPTDGN